MIVLEYFKCRECGEKWTNEFNTEDIDDFITRCPNGCDGFDFHEITPEEFMSDMT